MSTTTSGQAVCELKDSQVFRELTLNGEAIESLRERVLDLEKRLLPVLLNNEPTEASKGEDEENLVPIAAMIRSKTKAINGICSTVNNIINRLEL